MANRRRSHYGEGSVYTSKNGRPTACMILPDGRRKYFYGATEKEAREKMRKAQRELEQGTLITAKEILFKDYVDYWWQIKRPTLKGTTIVSYRFIIDKYLLPGLGMMKLRQIAGEHIQKVYSSLQERKLKGGTIRCVHKVVNMIFSEAVRQKRLAFNPCSTVTLPRIKKEKRKFLTIDQAYRLLEAARGHRIEIVLQLAIMTGMRKGEILALHWDDIDFEQKTIQIERSLMYKNVDGNGVVYEEVSPKTESGVRTIPLVNDLMVALQRHAMLQAKQREQAITWAHPELVVSTKKGEYFNESTMARDFKLHLKKAKLPDIHFHDLRHTAATIMKEQGVDLLVIQEWLGHAKPDMSLDYSHATNQMREEGKKKWNQVFQRKEA